MNGWKFELTLGWRSIKPHFYQLKKYKQIQCSWLWFFLVVDYKEYSKKKI